MYSLKIYNSNENIASNIDWRCLCVHVNTCAYANREVNVCVYQLVIICGEALFYINWQHLCFNIIDSS